MYVQAVCYFKLYEWERRYIHCIKLESTGKDRDIEEAKQEERAYSAALLEGGGRVTHR